MKEEESEDGGSNNGVMFHFLDDLVQEKSVE